jgi:SSS family solute:Na+ symporter
MTLTALDVTVVALFLGAILALGFSARLRDNTILQYLAAGRNLSLTAFVATLVSTWYGGILGIGESVSYYGWGTWLLMGVPYYAFALFYAFWLAKRVRSADQISLPERLHSRWGRGVGVIGAVLIFLLALPAAHVLMLGVLLRELTTWDLSLSVIVAAVGGTLFLYRGGLLADVRASLLAFAMMYVGFVVIVVYSLIHHPPAAAFAGIENRDLLTFTGGSGWPVVVSFFILGAWTIVDPGFHQRVASAASPEVGKRGVLVAVFFWMLFDVLSITTGMYALALLKPLPEQPLAYFPELADRVLPPGLKAVFLCGMLGTITCAMVGYTLVSGATFGREMLARLTNEPDDAKVKGWTRAGLALATVLAVIVGLQVESVVALWYSWAGAVVGALLIPVLLAYARPDRSRASSAWVGASMVLAAGCSLAWMAYGLRTNNAFLNVMWLKVGGEWRMALPPVDRALEARATDTLAFGLGTLLPGLIVSTAVLAVGEIVGRRKPGR